MTQPNLGGVGSWSRKIYLLFWLSLIGGTGLAVFIIPRVLDSAQEQGYREIDGQGRPPLERSSRLGSVATRFPVRPILDDLTAEPPSDSSRPERQAFPSSSGTPGSGPVGLPQRDVDRQPDSNQAGQETVTSRARVVRSGSVYESPRTTARVLGTVSPGTQVRWVRTVEPGWEEILLRDGRLVYMLSQTLSTSGDRVVSSSESDSGGDDSLSLLPSTVDDFLANLRDGDFLRASTYLAPTAAAIEEPDLGVWSTFVGADSGARVGRIEPVTGRGPEWRSVLLLGNAPEAQILTTWEWDSRQERWLMANWE